MDHDDDADIADWKAFNKSVLGEALPKRGDKDFDIDGTGVQRTLLEESRHEMYTALSGVRGHHLRHAVGAVWLGDRALVPRARGSFFRDMGTAANVFPGYQSVWLDAYEVVYLAERGSITVHLGGDGWLNAQGESPNVEALPQLSISHLYLLALHQPDAVDRYQVFAYLRRLGYIVAPYRLLHPRTKDSAVRSMLQSLRPLKKMLEAFRSLFAYIGLVGRPLLHALHYSTTHYFSYTSLFHLLQVEVPPITTKSLRASLTFNVWKPVANFSKKNPPPPDFHVYVANTAQPMPTLGDINTLVGGLNRPPQKNTTKVATSNKLGPTKRELRARRQQHRHSKLDPAVQARNTYLKLRDSHLRSSQDSFVLAAVSSGIINFTSVGLSDFRLHNQPELDDIYRRNHGLVWMESI